MKTIYQERYVSFIEALIMARKQAGLTQTQVAQRLSKPQSYVAKIEGSDRKLDVLEFVALCAAINADPTEMIRCLQK